jgi:TRAP-type C4-dicarboxylate transport system permease small subunit
MAGEAMKGGRLSAALDALNRLEHVGGLISTLVIWLLAVTVTYDVALRFFGIPTLWAAEVSIYLMIAMAFIGAGSTQGVDGHFRVTFIRDMCSPPVRTTLDVLSLLLSLAFAILLTAGVWRLTSFSWMLDLRTSTILEIPLWILQGLMLLGGVLLALATLRDLILVLVHGSAVRDAKSGAGEVI